MLRFFDQACFLEIDGFVEDNPSLQSQGDARLMVHVQSNGYAGQATAWIRKENLLAFKKALVSLNSSLRGEAALSSMSPGELEIKIASVSSRGHFSVEGSIGRHLHSESARFWHSVSFGFKFEQSQLEQAIHASWLPLDAA